MKKVLENIKLRVNAALSRFSPREKKLAGFGMLAIALVIMVQGAKLSKSYLEDQEIQLLRIKSDLNVAAGTLRNYKKLKLKRDQIEKEYEKLEFKEGALSYLDSLIKQKLGDAVKQNFNITPRPPQPFGLAFELNPFSIKFTVPSLEKLTDFLKEAVWGANPMFITKLDMTKNYRGDGLDVEVELSCIQKAGAK